MVAEPRDESVEGGAVRHLTEPADQSEFWIVLEPADQLIDTGEIQDKPGKISPPECLQGITWAAIPSVLPESIEQVPLHQHYPRRL